VLLACQADHMERFFRFSFAHRPSYRLPRLADEELLAIAEVMLRHMNYKFTSDARDAFVRYIALRKAQPLFSNARSIRNALDRIRLRQANRLVADQNAILTVDDVQSVVASDVLASRVFETSRPAIVEQ